MAVSLMDNLEKTLQENYVEIVNIDGTNGSVTPLKSGIREGMKE